MSKDDGRWNSKIEMFRGEETELPGLELREVSRSYLWQIVMVIYQCNQHDSGDKTERKGIEEQKYERMSKENILFFLIDWEFCSSMKDNSMIRVIPSSIGLLYRSGGWDVHPLFSVF